jgi:hypothetical protein
MDKETEKLYAELGGIGTPDTIKPALIKTEPSAAAPSGQDESLDRWRTVLVELAYILNASLRDAHYWEGVKADKDTVSQFEDNLRELAQMPDHDGTIRIFHRGVQNAEVPDQIDYVIELGDVVVDVPAIKALTRRMGLRVKHLEGRLQKSFEAFATQAIKTMTIAIPEDSTESTEAVSLALRVMSSFNYAVENESPIRYTVDENECSLTPVINEAGQPDPNLTMVAALNRINAEAMQNLAANVHTAVAGQNLTSPGGQPLSVYQAMFQIKSLRQKLVKPPIEMNSDALVVTPADQAAGQQHTAEPLAATAPSSGAVGTKPLIASTTEPSVSETESRIPETESRSQDDGPSDQKSEDGAEKIESSAADSQPPATIIEAPAPVMVYPIDSGMVKARVARFIKRFFGKAPQRARKAIKSLYGRDFKGLSREDLGERLILVTDMLQEMPRDAEGRQLIQEVLGRVEREMARLPQELLDDFVVEDGNIKIWSDKGEKSVHNADENLLNVIGDARKRSAEKKKLRRALNPSEDFTQQDFEQIAYDFGISAGDAEKIVQLFKSCFDAQNNFLRASFESKVTQFAQYNKAFDVLWAFLKETPHRGDRLPFLNSLQTLIKEVNNPIQAIKILLADFILDPDGVEYPDRNAIMLVNQFLRTYNKEINMDIEITPEEVLLISEGLNTGAVNYAKWKVDGDQKAFNKKFTTISKHLLQSIDTHSADANQLPIRFLLALEREIHICLSLIGGSTAHTVIREALKEYGNPESEIFQSHESHNHISALLQHLGVLIRGFGRLGKIEDLALLDEVKSKQADFLNLVGEDMHNHTLVRRLISWIDASENSILGRHR